MRRTTEERLLLKLRNTSIFHLLIADGKSTLALVNVLLGFWLLIKPIIPKTLGLGALIDRSSSIFSSFYQLKSIKYQLICNNYSPMSSPNPKQTRSPNSKPPTKSPSPSDRNISPNSRRQLAFRPKTLNELKPLKPGERSSKSPSSRHERSFSTIYSKFLQHKCYEDIH